MTREYGGKELAKVFIYYGLIADVVSSDFNIICPFHEDINPSMRVCLTDGSFFCFGCEAKGNALDFVKKVHPELNELQACVLLEQILNSDEVKTLNVKYRKKRRLQNKQALNEAHDYYYGLRTVDWNDIHTKEEHEVLQYMKRRGFDERALNIAHCKTNYNIAYPFLFPILDNGEFKGWVGRTMNKYVEKKRKYLYNDGFRKRDTLCGTYEQNKVVFVCEGFMDYLSLRTRGHIKNVVAILGWHISDEQVQKLKDKGVTTVVSALDNDKAGNKGTEYLKQFFHVIRFAYPDGIKDAGEMSEQELKMAIRRTRRAYKRDS
jgi:DNA primase